MEKIFYPGIVLAVALVATIYGFRKAFTGQISSLLGFAFGAVSARVFTPRLESGVATWISGWCDPDFIAFVANMICAVGIYSCVFLLFSLTSGIFRGAFSVFEVGMFNRIAGAFFSLVCNLLWLSIFLNLYLCLSPGSGLMRYEISDDGNMVAAVMAFTPRVLGCVGADDFAHKVQLQKAATIS